METSSSISCQENPMDRRAWWATVHGVSKSQAWLNQLSMHITWKAKNQKTNPKNLAVLGKTYYLGDHYFAFHPHLLLLDTSCSVPSKELSKVAHSPSGKIPGFEQEDSKFTFQFSSCGNLGDPVTGAAFPHNPGEGKYLLSRVVEGMNDRKYKENKCAKLTIHLPFYIRRYKLKHWNKYTIKGETDYQPRLDAWDKCSGLVHWEDSEGWDGEGGGRQDRDGEHM